jgi:hypothetical protein
MEAVFLTPPHIVVAQVDNYGRRFIIVHLLAQYEVNRAGRRWEPGRFFARARASPSGYKDTQRCQNHGPVRLWYLCWNSTDTAGFTAVLVSQAASRCELLPASAADLYCPRS